MNLLKMKVLERANKAIWDATLKLQSIRRMVKAIQIRKILKQNKCALIIQSFVRRKKANAALQQRKYYMRKLRQIQRFYHKRFQKKVLSSIKIQKWYRIMVLKSKNRKIGQCSKLIYKLSKVKKFRSKLNGFLKLKKNTSAIFIQCKLRQFLGLKERIRLSYNRAAKNFQFLSRKLLVRFSKYFAHRVKTLRYKLATKLQKFAKLFLKRRKFIEYLRKRRKNRSAIRIQALYKGFKARKYIQHLKTQKREKQAQRIKKLNQEKKQQLLKKQTQSKIAQKKMSNPQIPKIDEQSKDQSKIQPKKKNMKKVIDCMVDRLYQSTNNNQTPTIQSAIQFQKKLQIQKLAHSQLADMVQLSNRYSQMTHGVNMSQPRSNSGFFFQGNKNQAQQHPEYYQNPNTRRNERTSSVVLYQSISRAQNIYKQKTGGTNRRVKASSSIGKNGEIKTLQNEIYNEKIIRNQMNLMIKRQNQAVQKEQQQIQQQQLQKKKQTNSKAKISLPEVKKTSMKVKDQVKTPVFSPQLVKVKRDFIASSIKGIKQPPNYIQKLGEISKKQKGKQEEKKKQPKMPNMSTKQGKKSVTKRPYNHNYMYQQQSSSPSINSKRNATPTKRQSQSNFNKSSRHFNQNATNKSNQNGKDQKKIYMTYNKQQIEKFYSRFKNQQPKQNSLTPDQLAKSQYPNCFINCQTQQIRSPIVLSPQAQQYGVVGGFSTFNNSSSNHNTLYNSNSQNSLESSERFYLVKSSSKGIICMDRPSVKNSKAGRTSSSSMGKSRKMTPTPTPPAPTSPLQFEGNCHIIGMSEKISSVINQAQMKHRQSIYSSKPRKKQEITASALSKCSSQERMIYGRGKSAIKAKF